MQIQVQIQVQIVVQIQVQIQVQIVVQYQRTQKIPMTPIAMIILRIMEITIILTIQRMTNKITKEKDMRRSISFLAYGFR